MCIIAICEKNRLSEATFKTCWDNNSHGAGFAHWDGESVLFIKGLMTEAEAWEAYKDFPLPHVAHFRLASSGGKTNVLTHPFIISAASPLALAYKGKESVLFHNGTLTRWEEMLTSAVIKTGIWPEGELSDSRALAVVLSQAPAELLTLHTGNKFVVVSPLRAAYWGNWEKDEETGTLFSNSGYKASRVVTYYHGDNWEGYQRDWTGYQQKKCSDCEYKDGERCFLTSNPLKDDKACHQWEKKVEVEGDTCLYCEHFSPWERGKGGWCRKKNERKSEVENCGEWTEGNSRPNYKKMCVDCKAYELRKGEHWCKEEGKVEKRMYNLLACGTFKEREKKSKKERRAEKAGVKAIIKNGKIVDIEKRRKP